DPLDQPLGDEGVERLADAAAVDADPVGELGLDEPVTGRQLPPGDRRPELPLGGVACRCCHPTTPRSLRLSLESVDRIVNDPRRDLDRTGGSPWRGGPSEDGPPLAPERCQLKL